MGKQMLLLLPITCLSVRLFVCLSQPIPPFLPLAKLFKAYA